MNIFSMFISLWLYTNLWLRSYWNSYSLDWRITPAPSYLKSLTSTRHIRIEFLNKKSCFKFISCRVSNDEFMCEPLRSTRVYVFTTCLQKMRLCCILRSKYYPVKHSPFSDSFVGEKAFLQDSMLVCVCARSVRLKLVSTIFSNSHRWDN